LAKQQTVVIPKELEQEVTLLRGFRDLVHEGAGYMFGAKALSQTMSDETATERKAVTDTGKAFRKALKTLIKTPNQANGKKVRELQVKVTDAKEKNKTAREPHMKKITPLRRADRYIRVVAIPDSLKELGTPVTPRFSLSEWAKTVTAKKQKS